MVKTTEEFLRQVNQQLKQKTNRPSRMKMKSTTTERKEKFLQTNMNLSPHMPQQVRCPNSLAREAKKVFPPQLYTTFFNKSEDLLFAGGAGKNEMRVFDWNTGNIVALIGNLNKSVLCGAISKNTKFCFGSADSRVRIFDIQSSQSTHSVLGGGGYSNRSYQL